MAEHAVDPSVYKNTVWLVSALFYSACNENNSFKVLHVKGKTWKDNYSYKVKFMDFKWQSNWVPAAIKPLSCSCHYGVNDYIKVNIVWTYG